MLFNTLTGEMVLQTECDCEDPKELVEKRFLVPAEFDEAGYVEEIRDIARLIKGKSETVNFYTILTTTDCNARCFYCYELGIRRFPMTEDTARKLVEYIAQKHGNNPVKLNWFGGEPLYNMGVIDIVSEGLQARGIDFTSLMTSNGFYLTPEVSKRAKELWQIDTIQITIDGTREVYNRTKAFTDECADPFARVLDNIEAALNVGLTIGIRLNMDARNAEDLMQLADVLAERFAGRPNVHVHVEPLREFAGPIHKFGSAEELADCYWKLTDKLGGLGLLEKKELWRELRVNRCMADNDGSEVILPDGRIGRCEHIDESDTVGSIFGETRDAVRVDAWRETIRFPECSDCPLYPLCISLKKCSWTKDGCPEHIRLLWKERIIRQMKAAYLSLKE